jgi:hypothetical protein
MPLPRRFSPRTPALLLGTALLFPLIPVARTQTPPPVTNPVALVRHGVAVRLREDAEAANHPLRFVLHKQDEHRIFTQEIIETRQGDVALTVASRGRPLGPAARQQQIDRLKNLAANPALQRHRLRSEQAYQTRVDKILRMLPNAFIYHYVGIGPCDVTALPVIPIPGVPTPPPSPGATVQCYHLTFTPNPRWSPPDFESRVLTGMAGDVWMDTSSDLLHRLTAHLVSDVDFGWGIVGRLDKGGTVLLEQDQISGNQWELTHLRLNFTGKVLLLKSLRINIDETMGNFEPVSPNLDYREAIKMLLASQPAPGP